MDLVLVAASMVGGTCGTIVFLVLRTRSSFFVFFSALGQNLKVCCFAAGYGWGSCSAGWICFRTYAILSTVRRGPGEHADVIPDTSLPFSRPRQGGVY